MKGVLWRYSLLLIGLSLVSSCAFAQLAGNKYALVVGIDHYPHPHWKDLSYAVRDARGIAKLFEEMGFQVKTLYNGEATRRAVTGWMEDQLAPRLTESDMVVFFFAGHGETRRLGGRDWGYIVPADGTQEAGSLISMENLQTLSRKMGNARHQAFLMDSCFGGGLALRDSKIQSNFPDYLKEITRRKARQVLTAGGKDQQVVDGGPGGHSLFTGHLIKGIRQRMADLDGDGFVTFNELYNYLLRAASNQYQTPTYGALPGHELGENLFRVGDATRPIDTTSSVAPSEPRRGGGDENTGAGPEPARKAGMVQTFKIGNLDMKMVWCPPGKFMMGSPEYEPGRNDDEARHEVELTRGFWMAQTEVTQAQWRAVMGRLPERLTDSRLLGDDKPVIYVSWDDVQIFLNKLNEGGNRFRLPTEAEWEYACRAGTEGPYAGDLGQMAWYSDNANNKSHEVARKQPNSWGLYDMHGNAREWCADWFGSYAAGSVTDPRGPDTGGRRVQRGGSWDYDGGNVRSASRHVEGVGYRKRYLGVGFRPVRGL